MPFLFHRHEQNAGREVTSPGGLSSAEEAPVVLVVEDDGLIRAVIAEAIRDLSLSVVEMETGDEAWAYLSAPNQVDLVFTDLAMPGRIQGEDLVRLTLERFPEMKVIVASGNRAFSLGGQPFPNFFQKPYDIARAAELVRALVAS